MKHSSHRRGPRSMSASAVRSLIGRKSADARALIGRASERSHLMQEAAALGGRGTRKRAIVPVAVGGAALTGMFSLVSANVMAVNFTTGNNEFKLYSNYLDAQKAAAFLGPTTRASNATDCTSAGATGVNGDRCGVAELGIVKAKLAGLCGIATENIHIPIVNIDAPFSLMITAGDSVPDSYTGTTYPAVNASGQVLDTTSGTVLAQTNTAINAPVTGYAAGQLVDVAGTKSLTNAVSANNLFINSNMLQGYGNLISGLNLGMSADTVAGKAGITGVTGDVNGNGWPEDSGGSEPKAGNFGLYADQLNVAGLNGESYGLNLAGNITLPKLTLKVVPGSKTQTDCS